MGLPAQAAFIKRPLAGGLSVVSAIGMYLRVLINSGLTDPITLNGNNIGKKGGVALKLALLTEAVCFGNTMD